MVDTDALGCHSIVFVWVVTGLLLWVALDRGEYFPKTAVSFRHLCLYLNFAYNGTSTSTGNALPMMAPIEKIVADR